MTADACSAHMIPVNQDPQLSVPAHYRGPACNLFQDCKWQQFISRIEEFAGQHGLITLKSTTVLADGYRLGYRSSHYRSAYRKGHLSPEQIASLESLPGWTWRHPHEELWDGGIAALTAFADREGHCSVPRTHIEGGVRLGLWVDNKRKSYRKGILTAEQIAQLEALPVWGWDPYADRWWPDFETFKAYVTAGGSAVPEPGTVASGLDVHLWCRQQRNRHRIGTLSAQATTALESVPGWNWTKRTPRETAKNRYASRYRRFVLREGHGRVPFEHIEWGVPLGRYLASSRSRLKSGIATESYVAFLDGVSTDWRLIPNQMDDSLQQPEVA